MNNAGKSDSKTAVRRLRIDDDSAGQRVDNYLTRILKGVPKSHIYRLLRRGEVRVNKGRVRAEYRLRAGDEVRIPPVRTAQREALPVSAERVAWLAETVLHEDDRLLVLNKPAGIAVHGGSGVRLGVIEALRAWRPQAPFLELVHRLDRDTSGLLLVAKRRSALRAVQEALRQGRATKRYLALLHGRLPRRVDVDAPLRKNVLRSGERVVRVDPTGREARSRFSPREHLAVEGRPLTLAGIRIYTGRTHQIRVHAAHLGHPLVGDEKYGDAEADRPLRARGLKRLFLHAESLALPALPWAPQGLEFHAPLAPDLNELLLKLRINE